MEKLRHHVLGLCGSFARYVATKFVIDTNDPFFLYLGLHYSRLATSLTHPTLTLVLMWLKIRVKRRQNNFVFFGFTRVRTHTKIIPVALP